MEIPNSLRRRCAELTTKSRQGTITAVEYAELMSIVDQIELINAAHLESLVRLAQQRNISLDELIADLNIQPLSYE